MKLYIIAGEASGDLHGSNLIKEIKQLDPSTDIRCWGGELMQAEGGKLVKHYKDLAFMGFVEVLLNIRTILRNIDFCKKDILEYKPDTLVLIDYPGFNLRIAEWAKEQGIRVVYYISPQIWAWKQGRVHKIKKVVDEMCVVLPFEQDFYKKFDYPVHFVGHPLLDEIEKKQFHQEREKLIVLLPGSRKQEIKRMLPIMLEASKHFPEYKYVIAGAPGQEASFYHQFMTNSNIELVFGKTYELLNKASIGLITSGTATLEAGLFKLPQIVCYKGSAISIAIARMIIKIKYISLVNLILDRPAVLELIQSDLNQDRLQKEMSELLFSPERKEKMKSDYDQLHTALGGKGASKRTAMIVLKSS